MSMQAINFALTLPVDEPGPRLLLILISHHVNWRTGDMFVTQEELAKEARMSSRTVRTHLASLEADGLIIREQQRGDGGRREADKITLVGYLEWQDVIYNGGTIQNPETRGKRARKPAETPAEDFSGSDEANRKDCVGQPEKSGEPTGNCFPVYREPLLTIKKPLSAPLPPTAEQAPSGQSIKNDSRGSGIARPRITITAEFPSWPHWLDRIERDRGPEARRAVELLGRLEVAARWPTDDTPTPVVTVIRDPSGADA